MKILVTGGAGFIGSQVAVQLARCAGVEVLLGVRPGGNLWRLHELGVAGRKGHMHLVSVDLADAADARRLLVQVRPDVLLHLARLRASGDGHESEAGSLHHKATTRLQQAFLSAGGKRFITAGSCLEYGEQNEGLLEESMPPRPICEKGRWFAATTEAVLQAGASHDMEALVLRLFAPYGPMQDAGCTVPKLLAGAQGSRPAPLDEAEQVRDFTFVEDVARALVVAALRPRLPRKQAVYNVCTGTGHSLRQLAAHAAALLEGEPARPLPKEPGRPWSLVGDPQQVRRDLLWQATCPLEAGLRRTLRAMQPALHAA